MDPSLLPFVYPKDTWTQETFSPIFPVILPIGALGIPGYQLFFRNRSSTSRQPVEFPTNHEKPGRQEQTIDVVAGADKGQKSLTHNAQSTSHNA
jgi:hypothetical protein